MNDTIRPHRTHTTIDDAIGGPVKLAIATYDGRLLWSLAFVRRLPEGLPLLLDLRTLPLPAPAIDDICWTLPLQENPSALAAVAQQIDLVALAETQQDRLVLYRNAIRKGD